MTSDAVLERSRVWDIMWLVAGLVAALFFAGLFGTLAQLVGSTLFGVVGFMVWMTISVTQLVWIVPSAIATIYFRRTRYAGYGLLIGALLIFLVQSACYGAVVLFFNA